MKDKKLFNKILLYIVIILIVFVLMIFVLGKINRDGYLSNIHFNADETLKINNLDIENTKKLFSLDNKLDYSSLTNYIFTNNNISKYSYNFRISYYSKVFRNSDIYGVYLSTNSLPNYIKYIQFVEKGSPFGVLSSSKILEENIDNIQYSLKIKSSFYIIILLFFILLSIFIYILNNIKLKLLILYKINNIRYACILSIFLCFLIMPNIIYKVFYDKFDHTNYENRTLSTNPILDINNLDKYPKEYENYFNDHVSFRNELVQLKNIMDIFVFKNLISKRAFLGKYNWLFRIFNNFLDNYIINDMYSKNELDSFKNNILNFQLELKKKNIELILMICQDKINIYYDKLPDYIIKNHYTSSDQFAFYIRENLDIKLVYPKEELIKYKDKYQLYFKHDTHWNNLGGYIGFYEFMRVLGKKVDSIDSLDIYNIYPKYIWPYNDIAATISLSKYKQYHSDNYYIISNYSYDNFKIVYSNNSYNFKLLSEVNNNEHIFFIRDSFAIAMTSYIANNFNKSTFVHINDFKYDMLLEDIPNIVVIEILDTRIKDFFGKKLPSYDIEKLNDYF